jgi:ABC-2 type transport system ATP-binding protein
MNTQQPVIQTENLTKVYKARTQWEVGIAKMPKVIKVDETRALGNLNLTVYQGEIFGYLGPNGSGKTTTIRLLLDLIRPDAGRASIFGMDVNRDSVELHKRIGFLPGELNLWKNLTAMQVVQYVASVRGGVNRAYVLELAERLDFDPTKKVRDYSSGNRRKLGLILSLMNKPDLLILDEPTNGLDPLVQQTFHNLMREVRDEGRTVFLSSHVLSEVQAICDRVGILRHGELKAVERVNQLTQTDFRWVTVLFKQPVVDGRLNNVAGVSDVTVEGNKLHLRLSGDFDPLLRAIGEQYVVDLQVREPTLEEIFLTFYGNNVPQNSRVKEAVK